MQLIKRILKKIAFEIKMHWLDANWKMKFFRCWEPYPPSFYYRHTEEERKKIIARDRAELLELIEGLADGETNAARQ